MENLFISLEQLIPVSQPRERLSNDIQQFYEHKIKNLTEPHPSEIEQVQHFFLAAFSIAEELNELPTEFFDLIKFCLQHSPKFLEQFNNKVQKFRSWKIFIALAKKEISIQYCHS